MSIRRVLEFKWAVLATICGLMSLGIGLYFGWHTKPEWFSRFGSLVVLFGVITEYQVGRLPFQRPVKKLSFAAPSEEPTVKKKPMINDFSVAMCGHILAIGGTLIWGFGDVFIECIKKT